MHEFDDDGKIKRTHTVDDDGKVSITPGGTLGVPPGAPPGYNPFNMYATDINPRKNSHEHAGNQNEDGGDNGKGGDGRQKDGGAKSACKEDRGQFLKFEYRLPIFLFIANLTKNRKIQDSAKISRETFEVHSSSVGLLGV
ncbi:hypothetical protein AJ79_00207 [Helicocarpus griseus UAMH5409]|uniref:Uncharacterized protein n=1 Tax=Helicocarpus griseus UAMH5409 TaxID=1447875 RepID=A0A2B7Y3V7_9EURO|nr:hypothetical protein AJ79_00207 [Helicocarpus griseus UAMH5409]